MGDLHRYDVRFDTYGNRHRGHRRYVRTTDANPRRRRCIVARRPSNDEKAVGEGKREIASLLS